METFDFYFRLKVGKLLFSNTDKLSDITKRENVSSKRLAILTVETISDLPNSKSSDALYNLCLKEIQKIEFIKEPKRNSK